MNTLQICPPHWSDVATLPIQNPKVIFNIIIIIRILQDIYVITEENKQELL